MNGDDRKGLLSAVDSRTKVLALIALVAEALFLGSLATLPAEHTIWALAVSATILVVTIVGIVVVEVQVARKAPEPAMLPSALTPDSSLLDELVNGAIQTVCRAVSVPQTPESARLRVFIFRKDQNRLVCTHYWSPNPARELVGRLSFELRADLVERVAVVKAAINDMIARTEVTPLPADITGIAGDVDQDLKFVLACPIYDRDGSVWGVLDFDAATESGMALLKTSVSDAVMFQLAKHIRVVFSLSDSNLAVGG